MALIVDLAAAVDHVEWFPATRVTVAAITLVPPHDPQQRTDLGVNPRDHVTLVVLVRLHAHE